MPFSAIGPDQPSKNLNPYAVPPQEPDGESSFVQAIKRDQQLAAGRVRELGPSGRPDRNWTSQRPNAQFMWDYVDASTLNSEAHAESIDILEAWKFAPWKGCIYEGKIWREETTYSGHWEAVADRPVVTDVQVLPASCSPSSDVQTRFHVSMSPTCKLGKFSTHVIGADGTLVEYRSDTLAELDNLLKVQGFPMQPSPVLTERSALRSPLNAAESESTGKSLVVTRHGIDAAYRRYSLNPDAELENLRAAIASFASRDGRRAKAVALLNSGKADIYLEADDIIADFVLDLLNRFDKGQYRNREYAFNSWIGFVWRTYFFPTVETKIGKYLKLTTFMNPLDQDDPEYEVQSHSGLMSSVELELSKREAEGYRDPASVAKILRALDDPTSEWSGLSDPVKQMIRAKVWGATQKDAATAAGVGERQGNRLWKELTTAAGENTAMREQLFSSTSKQVSK